MYRPRVPPLCVTPSSPLLFPALARGLCPVCTPGILTTKIPDFSAASSAEVGFGQAARWGVCLWKFLRLGAAAERRPLPAGPRLGQVHLASQDSEPARGEVSGRAKLSEDSKTNPQKQITATFQSKTNKTINETKPPKPSLHITANVRERASFDPSNKDVSRLIPTLQEVAEGGGRIHE